MSLAEKQELETPFGFALIEPTGSSLSLSISFAIYKPCYSLKALMFYQRVQDTGLSQVDPSFI
jgi:hypothetical protein